MKITTTKEQKRLEGKRRNTIRITVGALVSDLCSSTFSPERSVNTREKLPSHPAVRRTFPFLLDHSDKYNLFVS